jgi:hypothetical protein
VPALFFGLTFRCRNAIHAQWPASRAPLAAATKILHQYYRAEVCWWESADVLRRLLLAGFLVLIPSEMGFARILTALLINVLFGSTFMFFVPYRRADDNMLAMTASIILTCSFVAALMVKVFDDVADEFGMEQAGNLLGYSSTYSIAMVILGLCFLYLALVIGSVLKILIALNLSLSLSVARTAKDEDRSKPCTSSSSTYTAPVRGSPVCTGGGPVVV